MIVIIVNGIAGSGKDTFMDDCINIFNTYDVHRHTKAVKYSIIDPIKKIAKDLCTEYETGKTDAERKLLGGLKHVLDEFNGFCMKNLRKAIADYNNDETTEMMFVCIRNHNDIESTVKYCNDSKIPVLTVFIRRPGIQSITSSEDDLDILKSYYKYNRILSNDGDLEKLNSIAFAFISSYFLAKDIDVTIVSEDKMKEAYNKTIGKDTRIVDGKKIISESNRINAKFKYVSADTLKKTLSLDELVHSTPILPIRKTEDSAGYDFFSPASTTILPGEQKLIWTNVKVSMPKGYVLEIYPRSSYGIKKGAILANTVGIIDADYYNNPDNEGNIGICLKNLGKDLIRIEKDDAIAQGIFKRYYITEDDHVVEKRVGGIGSTDKKKEDAK